MLNRRRFVLGLLLLALAPWARAGALDGISEHEASQALHDGLARNIRAAFAKLGKENGYFANPKIKIGLPKNFRKADRVLRGLGQGKKIDDLILAMNRSAEAAAPQAREVVTEAARKMVVTDAKTILSAGDDAATQYFRKVTEADLSGKLMPIVKSAAEGTDMSRAYRALSDTLMGLAGIKSEQSTVEAYVNEKMLAGIYLQIAEEERAMRANPALYGGGLPVKVFGLLK